MANHKVINKVSARYWKPEEIAMLRHGVNPPGRTEHACDCKIRRIEGRACDSTDEERMAAGKVKPAKAILAMYAMKLDIDYIAAVLRLPVDKVQALINAHELI